MKSENTKKSEDLNNIQLSAMVICQNEERNIARCLESLAFCDEIIVIDSYSRDQTLDITNNFTKNIFQRKYTGTNDQKEFGRTKCTGKWILNLDADEYVPEYLVNEIQAAITSKTSHAGYRIPVKTHLGGYFLKHNGYFPGYQKRLFIKEQGYWDNTTEPHDKVVLNGKWGKLTNSIIHHTADNFSTLQQKAIKNGLIAYQKKQRSHSTPHSKIAAWFRSEWRFIRSYIFKHGFLDFKYGYKIAKLNRLEGKLKYFGSNPVNKHNHSL